MHILWNITKEIICLECGYWFVWRRLDYVQVFTVRVTQLWRPLTIKLFRAKSQQTIGGPYRFPFILKIRYKQQLSMRKHNFLEYIKISTVEKWKIRNANIIITQTVALVRLNNIISILPFSSATQTVKLARRMKIWIVYSQKPHGAKF